RLRGMKCVRCHSQVGLNAKGLPNTHQCSHFCGRGNESTRFDPENAYTLCGACHRIWGSDDREAYRAFKIKQLGKDGFDALMVRANTTTKKDRKFQALIWKTALKEMI